MEFLNSLLPAIQHFGFFGYWIVLLASLGESLAFVGTVIPGGVIVVLAGFFSARGYLDLGDLIWFAAIGAILGDSISYWLGTKGAQLFRSENRILKLSLLEKGETFFKKHGNKSILLGRFIGPLRPIVPFVAGLFKMNKRSFLVWNITSAFLWATSYLLLGYFFGGAIDVIEMWSTRAGFFALIVFFSLGILWFLIKKSPALISLMFSVGGSIKEAIISNPDIRKLVERHPYFFAFVKRRLNREKFSGLSLTLLCVGFIYVLSLFFGIVQDVVSSDLIVAADIRVANLLFAFRDAELLTLFTWITVLGKWQIVVSGAIVASLVLWLWRKRTYIFPLWITIVGSEIFNLLGKLAFHRPRPDVAYYMESGFSFPSGHATIAVAFYGFLTYVLFRESKHWGRKANAIFWGLTIIFAIGLSRLYLGVHFVSDVWGGYLSGLLWLIIGITFFEWIRTWRKTEPIGVSSRVKIISSALILLQLGLYVVFASHYQPPRNVPLPDKVIILTENILEPFSDSALPVFTETLIGTKQEPLSFLIVAKNDTLLIEVMNRAGWRTADQATFSTVFNLAKFAALSQSYPTAPMTPSFWNAVVHDFGFEKETETQSVRERHHARFWRTSLETADGNRVYVGTASLDIGLKWLVTHKIGPDIDTERELLFTDLQNTGLIATSNRESFTTPTLGENFSGDAFFTDGKMYLIFFEIIK